KLYPNTTSSLKRNPKCPDRRLVLVDTCLSTFDAIHFPHATRSHPSLPNHEASSTLCLSQPLTASNIPPFALDKT
ncbi:hypothetical protein PspLS_04574, partial [Pyricularia sp. CBS 133598]